MNSMREMQQNSTHFRKRLALLLMAGIVIIGAVLFYRVFWYWHPIGDGPVAITVDRAPFSSVWTHRPVLLLGLGDSVTDGFGAGPGKSYFARVATNPPDEFADLRGISLSKVIPGLTVRNEAISGTTSIELLEFSLPRIEVQPQETFGIVLLTTGGNDIIHNYGRTPPREGAMYGTTLAQAEHWIQNFESRLNAILDQIETKFPGGCDILLANIYDPTDGAGDAEHAGLPAWPDGLKIIQAYNDIIARACARHPNVHLIDLHSAFLGHGIHCRKFWRSTYVAADPHYWYFDNLEDPNDRGYDAIRRLCLNALSEQVRSKLMMNPPLPSPM
jgi:lysophospholipase L1-like esterase